MVAHWRVLEGVETLSDHRYIRFDVSTPSSSSSSGSHSPAFPRWVLSKLDRGMVLEAALVQAWVGSPAFAGVDEEAAWFRDALSSICDSAMPRAKSRPSRRQVYWWTAELAELRVTCAALRREYVRQRRRRRTDRELEARLYDAYRGARRSLQLAISRAKDAARKEQLSTLNADPWGRPYQLVRGKLRPWAPPLTQTLEPMFLETVTTTLFPTRTHHPPPPMRSNVAGGDDEVPAVSTAELGAAVLRLKAKNTAPGPDGVPGRVLALALKALRPRLLTLFDACLQRGEFPQLWKAGRLVLLRKEGRPIDAPSAYRPIVLLGEVGKLFERILAVRLVKHLTRVGPDLSEHQFGFRGGRSTIDAILRVKTLSDEAVSGGGVLLAVSLDIANAFNTLPWSVITEALRYHGVPEYLRRVVGAYLGNRVVAYEGRGGLVTKQVTCGVPQGSVLGPLLWNIGYDWVLRGATLPGVSLVCYADDTLVLSRGRTHREASLLATAGVAHVVGRIRALGLEVALPKSEALFFHGPRKAPPAGSHIIVGGVTINVGSTMRYLGLLLDGRWTFNPHFERLGPRVAAAAAALGRLLPNLGGPKQSVRRLFMGVARSMALYGAPVWAGCLTPRGAAFLRRPQRVMAVRVIRGYRTVSGEAACLLAGSLPWDLEARALADAYYWRKGLASRGDGPPPRAVERHLKELRRALVLEWAVRLSHPTAGHRTIQAVHPQMLRWLSRRHGTLTFRLTQVLSGHGCFGRYLCRVAGREESTSCHHCDDNEDTAQHTLEHCPAWAVQRRTLVAQVGSDLSLPAIIEEMVGSEGSWSAIADFCEEVMALKEAAERERELHSALPIRARRPRRRRRADNALYQPP